MVKENTDIDQELLEMLGGGENFKTIEKDLKISDFSNNFAILSSQKTLNSVNFMMSGNAQLNGCFLIRLQHQNLLAATKNMLGQIYNQHWQFL